MIAAALLGLVAVPAPAQLPADPSVLIIPRDTPVELRTLSALSSQENVRGDEVALEVAEPVTIAGKVAVPSGARAIGQISRAERKGAFGAAGNLAIELLYVTVGDRPYRLRGTFDTRGKGANGLLMTSAYIVAVAAVITGKRAVVPAGTRLTGTFFRDVAIPATP